MQMSKPVESPAPETATDKEPAVEVEAKPIAAKQAETRQSQPKHAPVKPAEVTLVDVTPEAKPVVTKAAAPPPAPRPVAKPQPPRPVLDKYAEAKRQKKIAKRIRHRVTLRRSNTGG